MLIIRRSQMEALKQLPLKAFIGRMVLHLRKYFPEHCHVLGEAQTRKVIGLGIERADSHGFNAAVDVCRYINLMFMLGSFFDEDPQLPWAAEILKSRGGGGPKMKRLYDRAVIYLERVSGPDGEHFRRMLVRVRRSRFETLVGIRPDDLVGQMSSLLEGIYPQKWLETGEAGTRCLMADGIRAAEGHGLATPEGIGIYTSLIFILGSHFERDPLYPWAAATLADRSEAVASSRARLLYEEAIAGLNRYVSIGQTESGGES
jgi:hypothetical protein